MDGARKATDKRLAKMEHELTGIYQKSAKGIYSKWSKYMDNAAKRIGKLQNEYEEAKRSGDKDKIAETGKALGIAKRNVTLQSDDYKAMLNETTRRLAEVNQTATAYLNKSVPDIYALNYNAISGDAAEMGVQFGLVDAHTVKNLVNDGKVKLPYKKLDIPKDMRWNTKQLNSAVLQGILQGDSMPKIAKRVFPIVNNNASAAIRNARTMVTGAECAGRNDSYKDLESRGVVLKKVWIATPDGRTRESHLEMDGEEVDVDEAFSNGCMYPGDPNGDPAEVYNCRCTMRTHIVGFMSDDGSISEIDFEREETLHDRQMEEEKERREIEAEDPEATPEATQEVSFVDKIKAIADDVVANGVTEEKVMEAGKIFAGEINSDLKVKEAEYKQALENYDKAGNGKIQEIYRDPLFKEALRVMDESRWRGQGSIRWDQNQYFSSFDEAKAFFDKIYQEIEEISNSQQYKDAKRLLSLARKAYEGSPQENARVLFEKLSQIREMGSEGIDIKGHLQNSRSQMRKDIEYAYSLYPKSWVQASVDSGTLKIGTVSRGYYNHYLGELMISGSAGTDSAKETAIHELGHRFEKTVKGILDVEQSFYSRRTDGEPLQWLGASHAKTEKTRKDDFIDAYMGKDYNGKAYELDSMGFQYAYFSPRILAKDEDMQAWILGQLAVIP